MCLISLPRHLSTAVRCHLLFGLMLAMLCPAIPSAAQTASVRRKVGLALCGGGGLSLAHIGVIKWFEEHHVPIDCVTGTSGGGLVGSFYATGLSTNEIQAALRPMNWDEALAPETPYKYRPFRRKEDQRAVPTRLAAGLRGGGLPGGLIPGHPIGTLLSSVCAPYSDLKSFDDLPTPFRCMGVDMKEETLLTFKDGSLLTALRATMAAPGIFTPFQRDGKVLVDPGLFNNIPTEALRAMGPDIIIAVQLTTPPAKAAEKQTFSDLLKNVIFLANRLKDVESLKLADIVLTVDVNDLSSLDFSHLDKMIARGYSAAAAQSAALSKYALCDSDWNAYQAARQERRRPACTALSFVDVESVTGREKTQLEKRFQPMVGARVDAPRLHRLLTNISGEGRYDDVLYETAQREGQSGLRVVPQRKQYGSPFLKFGVAVNGADPDNIRIDTLTRLTAMDVGVPNGEIRTDLRLGTDRDLGIEYYLPFSNSRMFFAPRLFYTDDVQSRFERGFRSALYGTRTAGAALDFGYRTDRLSELRVGYQLNYLHSSVRNGSPLLPSVSGGVSVLSLRWAYDGQDSESVPMQGARLNMEGSWYLTDPGAPKAYPRLDLRLNSFHPVGGHNSVFVTGGAGTTFGRAAGPIEQFTVGGPFHLGAYGQEEFRGNAYGYASLGVMHQAGRLPALVGGKVLVGSWYEIGGAFSGFDHASYRGDLSIGMIAETLLGPIMVGGSLGEGGRRRIYFALGRLF